MPFNAAAYLLDRRLEAGDGDRLAVTGPRGTLTYTDLHDLTCRVAAGLRELGVTPGERVMLNTVDSPWMLAIMLAAMRIGAVPVPVSTMLRPAEVVDLVRDSEATVLVIGPEFAGEVQPLLTDAPALRAVEFDIESLTQAGSIVDVHPTTEDDVALWLYTSGTTGLPKGAMHRHASIRVVCETYARDVLGITADDRVFSVPKMFFAYGLGTSAFFPLSVGASTVLEPTRCTPQMVADRLREYRPTLFVAGPTFFGAMLGAEVPPDALTSVRLATSAGEPLPPPIYHRFVERYGVDIIDGLGSTEALHIFVSNRPAEVRPGTSGIPVPGYEVRVVDDSGADVQAGTEGHLLVSGASTMLGYWHRDEATARVLDGRWLRTGDFYVASEDGFYTYLGRSDDMLKSSGIWVSPAEVEACLLAHPDVAQAAVVGVPDESGLSRTVACVTLTPAATVTPQQLVDFCREHLAHFKCPKAVLVMDEIPLTATGKLRRNVVRGRAADLLAVGS